MNPVRPLHLENDAIRSEGGILLSDDAPLLEIKNLVVEFETNNGAFRAVDGISLSLERGEILAVVGESGSGKSVVMLAVLGLLPAGTKVSADRIAFRGQNLLDLTPGARRSLLGREIGMIFQDPMGSLNPCFTIGYQIEEVLKRHRRLPRAARRAKAIDLLARVGIPFPEQRIKSYPHQMSGGQCQRVMIAMALACEPVLLIADEPTTALDVTIQKQILELLLELHRTHHMGLIVISHNMGVVAEIADHVFVQYRGRMMECADVVAIFESPQNRYTQALLSALPENATGPLLPVISGPF